VLVQSVRVLVIGAAFLPSLALCSSLEGMIRSLKSGYLGSGWYDLFVFTGEGLFEELLVHDEGRAVDEAEDDVVQDLDRV